MVSHHPSFRCSSRPISHRIWRDPIVHKRIVEYLGGDCLDDATCLFLGRLDSENPSIFDRHPPADLDKLLDGGCEIARSLEDRESMLVHLDIEYVNFDDPVAAYTDAKGAFLMQQPLVEAIETCLLNYGIRYLHLITGQGHHFVWKFSKHSAVAKRIAGLGIHTPSDGTARATDPLFAHISLLMEYFAHRVKREASGRCELPVEITAQHVGPGNSGMREMLSIDISEYGDPLHSRMIRMPYTVYRKPWISGLFGRLGIEDRISEFFTLPLHEMDLTRLLELRHHPEEIIKLARYAGVGIPCEERGTARLLDDYLGSSLASFHRQFYAVRQDSPSLWPSGYDRTPLEKFPPCVAHVLRFPNDLLLKPSGIQLVVRSLLASGWHPRHIAGLIRSKFENPLFGWQNKWIEYDPSQRAEFYVRLFAGELSEGLDTAVDFNCVSQQEKEFCWHPRGCSLEPLREGLCKTYHFHPESA
ncbi:MAG: hypothetical protein RLY69_632 [Verrucomicrobiota bacterium]